MLADNKLALNAGWDLEMLSLEIGELSEAGFDLSPDVPEWAYAAFIISADWARRWALAANRG